MNQNLSILRQREAKYGGEAPLDLLNQIEDHQQAITLTEQAIAGEISKAGWREEMEPLLLPFWQGLSGSVLAALIEAAQATTPTAPVRALQESALAPLRQSPKGEVLLEGFADDPDAYHKPIQKELTHLLQNDPDFAARLHRLLADYEASQLKSGDTYNATLSGSAPGW